MDIICCDCKTEGMLVPLLDPDDIRIAMEMVAAGELVLVEKHIMSAA